MADSTFSQTIVLDGGDKVADELEKIGDAGEKAFEQTQTAADDASASVLSAISDLISGFRDVAKSIADAGVELGSVFKPFISAAQLALEGEKDVSGGLKDMAGSASGASDAVSKIWREVSTWFAVLKGSIASVGAALSSITPLSVAVFSAAGFAALGFSDKVISAAGSAAEYVKDMVESMGRRLQSIFVYHDMNTFQGWKNAALEFLEYLGKLFISKFYEIKEAIENIDWGDVWESVKDSAAKAWDSIRNFVVSAYDSIKSAALATFPSLAGPWAFIEAAVRQAWATIQTVASGIVSAFNIVLKAADGVAAVVNAMFGTNFTGATLLATIVVARFAAALAPIPGWVSAIGAVMTPFVATFTLIAVAIKGAVAAIDAILGKFQQLTDALSGKLLEALRQFVGPELWDGMKDAAQSTLDWIKTALEEVVSAANKAWSAITGGSSSGQTTSKSSASSGQSSSSSEIASIPGHASGGLLSGPGTGTSDSILIRASNGEHITPAQATSFWGGGVMEAIRSANLPGLLSALRLPGFASGGGVGDFGVSGFGVGGFGVSGFGTGGSNGGGSARARNDGMAWDDSIYGPTTDNGSRWGGDVIKGYDGNPDIIGTVRKAWSNLQQIGSEISGVANSLGFGSDSSRKYAGGGEISGTGTGTSDSILARVSNGEHITPAASTSFWGGSFMEAVRAADFPGLLKALQLPGFFNGGVIGGTPAFAGGGLLNFSGLAPNIFMPALAPFTLPKAANSEGAPSSRSGLVSFPLDLGGQHYELLGHKDTVAELQRHSALRQISATNKRSPGWNR